jgi:hypothetical protein
MLKKLISLGQKEWLSGLSNYYQIPTGIFAKGRGINPFVNPVPESMDVGILQTGGEAYDITGSGMGYVLDGVIRNTGNNAGNLYMVDSSQQLWDKNLANDSAPTLLRPSSTASYTNGLEVYQSVDGQKHLYYFTSTTIGRWDFDGPTGGFTDSWDTGVPSSFNHPTHQFKGAVYFGTSNGIGKIYSVSGFGASTATTGVGTLVLPADFIVSSLSDDGDYLVIGATKHNADNTLLSDTRVFYWDTVSQNFNKEWTLPDYGVSSLVKFKNGTVAFGGQRMWYFNLSNPPQHLRTLKNNDSSITNITSLFFYRAADRYNDAIIWGGIENYISAYGSLVPEAPAAYFQPFQRTGGNSNKFYTFVKASGRFNRLYASSNGNSTFVYYKFDDKGSTTETSAFRPETVYLDLGGTAKIEQINITLAEPLASTDTFTLSAQTDDDASVVPWGTISFSTTPTLEQGYKKRYELFKDGGLTTDQIKLLLDFSAGNVKIKSIDIYGTPV